MCIYLYTHKLSSLRTKLVLRAQGTFIDKGRTYVGVCGLGTFAAEEQADSGWDLVPQAPSSRHQLSPISGGYKKSWFVGSLCLCGLFGTRK